MRGEQPKNMKTQKRSILTRDVEVAISSTASSSTPIASASTNKKTTVDLSRLGLL